jgi:hypothetical protein
MPNKEETIAIVHQCWRELDRLHRSTADLSEACAVSKNLLATGAILKAEHDGRRLGDSGATPPAGSWRQKAREAREIAHRLTVANGKRRLLEVADSYERLAE